MSIIFDFGKINIHKWQSKPMSSLPSYELMYQSERALLELHLCLYRHIPKETDQHVYENRSAAHERLAIAMAQISTMYT